MIGKEFSSLHRGQLFEELIPILIGGKYEFWTVATPESLTIHFEWRFANNFTL